MYTEATAQLMVQAIKAIKNEKPSVVTIVVANQQTLNSLEKHITSFLKYESKWLPSWGNSKCNIFQFLCLNKKLYKSRYLYFVTIMVVQMVNLMQVHKISQCL